MIDTQTMEARVRERLGDRWYIGDSTIASPIAGRLSVAITLRLRRRPSVEVWVHGESIDDVLEQAITGAEEVIERAPWLV